MMLNCWLHSGSRLLTICRCASAMSLRWTPNTPENWPMLKLLSISLSVMLLMAVSGCGSTPPAQRVTPPPPAAWAMLPAPDLLTPLNGIISPLESGSARLPNR